MTAPVEIDLGEFNIGNTDRFRATILKDGDAWVLTSGTVTSIFKAPDRSTTFSRTMTAEDAAGGIFYYDSTVDDFTQVGRWTMGIRVVDGAVIKNFPLEIGFNVNDQPD